MALGQDDEKFIEVFPWNANLETGIASIDAQHKTLVRLLNELANHHVQKEPVELERVFDDLLAYAEFHFKNEEEIWQRCLGDHPWYAGHLKAHSSFLPAVQALKGDEPETGGDSKQDVLRFLIFWLVQHILEDDKRLAVAVRALEKGHSLEEAERLSNEETCGSATTLIDTVLSMYGELAAGTMRVMAEQVERRRIEAELRQAHGNLENTVVRRTAQLKTEVAERARNESALKERNRMIEILQRIAYVANACVDINETLQTCLDLVCEFTGWPVGHVYMLDREAGELFPTAIWHLDSPEEFEPFQTITEKTRFAPGIVLPGRVLTSGEPLWITNVVEDANFPRSKSQADIGVKAGFAFPILSESEVVAVLEFFSREAVEPQSNLFEMMDHIGAQIGQAIGRRSASLALMESQEKLSSIINASNVTAIVSIDDDGNLETWNHGAERAFGYSESEIIGRPLTTLIPERFREAHKAGLRRARETGEYRVIGQTVEVYGLHKDGFEFPMELSLGVWESENRKYFSAVINDITERKQAEKRIHHLAYTDYFTGMPNEASFLERLSEAITANREGFVASIELSGIGDIVGTFGLEAEEIIIYHAGKRFENNMAKNCVAARTGPRMFKILFTFDSEDAADDWQNIAETLFEAARQPYDLMGSEIHVNVSMGAKRIDPEKNMPETLLSDLEIAHFEAAKSASSCLVFFEDAIKDQLVRSTRIVSWLRPAIENNAFVLYFQPQISLETNRLIGCEALIRWPLSFEEWISPGEFIPIAERSGLIADITKWTVDRSCQIAAAWMDEHRLATRIGVNISAEELASADFFESVMESLGRTKLPPEQLEMEITETALMQDVEMATDNLRKLREQGLSVAVDDFGTGQASLAYLKTFPIDRLKIDQAFVKNAPDDKTDQEIITTIVKLAHSLEISVIAEGAEQQEHIDLLYSLGCDEVQGYFISKPMPSDKFVDFALTVEPNAREYSGGYAI